ncbi:MAG: amidohydrolase family protein [Planctomycetota bacterium]|nr:amidohydrolase family protein [Planctomycetota bacterium]
MKAFPLSIVVAIAATLAHAEDEAKKPIIAIVAGTILTVSGDPIADGVILIEDGKIRAVGQGLEIPAGAMELRFPEGTVIPGLVAAYSTLAEGGADPLESLSPDVQAIDGFDFFARRDSVLAGGVTAAYISPGKRRLLSGQGSVVRLAGGDPANRILRATVGVQVNLGEAPESPPSLFEPPLPPSPTDPIRPAERQLPTTRLGSFFLLRKALREAEENSPLAAVRDGKAPLFVRCQAARDIRRVLELAKEYDAHIVIQGGAEATRLVKMIAETGSDAAIESPYWPGARPPEYTQPDPESVRADPATAAALAKAGVPIALIPPADAELPDLLVLAARAHAAGLTSAQALHAITLGPARILGVADRIGSIEAGKDADVVILSGGPFETRSLPQVVIAGGDVVYQAKPRARRLNPFGGKGWTAIKAGRILTVSHGEIRNGTILMEGGKIRAVGEQVPIPEGAKVIDLPDSVVVPGFVDLQSRLGLPGEEAVWLPPTSPLAGPSGGQIKVSAAIVPDDPGFDAALAVGITTVVVIPGGSSTIGGQAVALKCGGADLESRIIADPAGIRFNLASGASPATPWTIRSLLKKVKEYGKKRDAPPKKDDDKAKEVKEDETLEPLRGLLKGEIPAFVRVVRPSEILAALEVFVDEFDVRLVFIGAEGSHVLTEEIRKRGVSVATGPVTLQRVDGEWISLPLRLAESGIPLAFQSEAARGSWALPLSATYAVRHGLDEATALRALTLGPARMAGIDSRVGSIEVGKDADLVVFSADPMDLRARVQKVFLDGELVHEE